MNLEHISDDLLRSYSSAFARGVFSDIANFSDFSHLDNLHSRYNEPLRDDASYMDYLSYMYSIISKSYRCEYVYKNEIINQLLLKKYGTKNTIAFNEFKVGDSIVDLAIMNGESKAFEIKTTLDSPKRLDKQMNDYKKVFNKCYIVVDATECDYYSKHIDENVGVLGLSYVKGRISLDEYRPAKKNNTIVAHCIMKCLRTVEYESIIRNYFGHLPEVSCPKMFEACQEWMTLIPNEILNTLFLAEIKKRKNVTGMLKSFPAEIRQLMLALNLPKNKQASLLTNLYKPINKINVCTTRI